MIKITKSLDFFDGATGCIETLVDLPEILQGIAVVTHPNPLFGGTYQNKVTATIARTLNQIGIATFRPNFRGVGKSNGIYDKGIGETEDILLLIEQLKYRYSSCSNITLAGFSFGAFVMTRVIQSLTIQDRNKSIQHIILAGVAAGMYPAKPIGNISDSLIIHGEQDDIIPLSDVLEWARPQALPLTVIPGADHFFSGKLHILKQLILRYYRPF